MYFKASLRVGYISGMNVLITVFKTILVFSLALPFFLGLLMARSAWRLKYYVPGVGTIVDAKVTERLDADNDIAYSIEITTRYEVDGKIYERRPSYSSWSGLQTYEDYVREVKGFPIGDRVAIYYDAGEPESYTFLPDSDLEQWSCAVILLLPSLVALAVMIWGW